ncbi:MAG: response regulator transcription factor [Clostridia bacterium]|nr:response regulator transcription factor [Clostridia bacterium]
MAKIRVMTADTQAVARRLYAEYIKSCDRYELAVSLPDASLCEPYLRGHKVDMIIMDLLTGDGESAFGIAKRIKEKYPAIKIIAVSPVPEQSWPERAKKAGADSFWYKETDGADLIGVMDRTAAGESVYPDRSPEVMLGLARSTEFTERELEVLRIITTGATNGDVAEELGISENTVKTHVRSMLAKTGFRSRTELAIKARVTGIALK